MKILSREQLDNSACKCCGKHKDEPIYLHSQCHPDAPTWAVYYGGLLKIICSECEQDIVGFEIK